MFAEWGQTFYRLWLKGKFAGFLGSIWDLVLDSIELSSRTSMIFDRNCVGAEYMYFDSSTGSDMIRIVLTIRCANTKLRSKGWANMSLDKKVTNHCAGLDRRLSIATTKIFNNISTASESDRADDDIIAWKLRLSLFSINLIPGPMFPILSAMVTEVRAFLRRSGDQNSSLTSTFGNMTTGLSRLLASLISTWKGQRDIPRRCTRQCLHYRYCLQEFERQCLKKWCY